MDQDLLVDLEGIERDEAAASRAAEIAERFLDEVAGPAAAYEVGFCKRATRRAAQGDSGGALLDKLTPFSRRRLFSILAQEKAALGAESDDEVLYDPLLFVGCQIVEHELWAKVGVLAEPLGELLSQALSRHARHQRLKAVIDGWLEGRVKVTLGSLHAMLTALRYCLKEDMERAREAVADAFAPDYPAMLGSKGFERSLGRIRNLRNEVAHPELGRELVTADYLEFCRLVVGSGSFRDWERWGPEDMDLSAALLHHHLRTWETS
jgi:hypothetical protein